MALWRYQKDEIEDSNLRYTGWDAKLGIRRRLFGKVWASL